MQTITRSTFKLVLVLILVAAMFGVSHPPSTVYAACSPDVFFDLYAKTGTAVLYGSTSVNIWGYSQASGDAATLPGDPLIVNQNDCVSVTLNNVNIPEATSLLFQGQSMVPDTTGVTAGNSKTYVFSAGNPGTFLYEAGLTDNAPHQVAMGMYGALIVRPDGFPSQAYSNASTAFDKESIMVLSEFDTALYTSPNTPATFDMRNFKGRYLLINGKAYPGTAPFTVAAGDKVLLRYINAGVQAHAMSTLGLTQTIIAQDGSPYMYSHRMVAETIATGQTLDTLVTIPAGAAAGSKFSIYDANMLLKNNTGTGTTNSGMGGMITFLSIAGSSGGDTGPLVSGITIAPNPTDGLSDVIVTASVSDATTGNANIQAAEFYIDSTAGSAHLMTAADTAFDSPSESVKGTISIADLASLSSGNHTVYVRGQDANNNWGPFSSGIVNLAVDNAGPAISALSASPNPSNGSSVNVSFTASDVATGNHNVTAAEYWIGAGAPQSITVLSPAPLKNLVVTLSGLSSGTNALSVRAQDSFGNWGAPSSINLIVDNVAPTASGLSAQKNPNNGSNPYNTSVPAVRVFATFTDTHSNIAAGEGFLNTVGATGTGFIFVPTDGSFNSGSESAYADIPLAVVGTLSAGSYPICVHAKDTVGNWGVTTTCFDLVIDKTPPTVSGVTLTPSASNNTAVVVSATANDTATGNSNIGGGEYFIDTAGAAGTGAVMTPAVASPNTTISATIPSATIAALTAGNHTVYVRARDVAGNWSTTISGTLLIDRTNPTISNVTVTPSPTNGAAAVTATVTASDNAGGSGLNGGDYWIDGTTTPPGVTTSFSGTTSPITISGINVSSLSVGNHNLRVRVKDVAGNFSAVFTRQFTVSVPVVPQPSIYFSTVGVTNPPGLGGTADDADIYLWNGSAYSRAIDASAAPYNLPSSGGGNANVDGFDRVDATHFYMSFNGGVTLPGGAGIVQDEDVVYYNAGTWSVFFDGTPAATRGLSGTDVDAISVVSGVLYFSTSDGTVPVGVSGAGDDADIYSWNGTSFSRVLEANGAGSLGLPSGANVDGFVRIDATHFYMSFAGSVTLPGGAGTAQDEDVVYYNAGTWSIYFDGSLAVVGGTGLDSSSNLDIDAFDLP